MKNLIFTSFLWLSIALLLNAQDRDYYPPSAVPDRIMLNLTTEPTTSMAVTWRTGLYVDSGFVQYTLADPSPDLEANSRIKVAEKTSYLSDMNGAHYFSAIMDSLAPGTLYAYRVGDKNHWSEWAHFKTANSADQPLSFIYFGDAQNDLKSMWSRAIRGAFQQMPKADFLLHAGDLVNRKNRDHEWGEWFYAGGWIYQMIPSLATPGNHEYGYDADGNYVLSTLWNPTFTLPENGPSGLKETAYYIDYQNIRVISIDAPRFLKYDHDALIQTQWLESILSNNEQPWTVVTMHYPIYSTKFGRDNEELRVALQPLFEKYNVDIVLTGHDHTYGRGTNLPIGARLKDALDGPIYVVSVSGPKMYDLGLDEWMQRGASNTQLYQLIHVDGNEMKFEAYTVDNQLYDAFELRKDADGNRLFIDLTPVDVPERLDIPPRFKDRFTEEELEDYQSRFQRYKARKAGQ